MEAEGICTSDIEGIDADTLIPVEILSCDVTPRARSQDATSIVELGKQLLLSARNGDTETVRDLMCRGAPFTTDWLGTSALHLAAQNDHLETAEVLLRAGISRDARTKVDRTPLHMAAYEGHWDMAQLLLNYGADVDSRDMLRMTPLHWAVERKCSRVMQVLLDHGADPNAMSKFDKSPITLALEHNRADLLKLLQQERELMGIQLQQQNQLNTAEIEAATQHLMQIEPERNEQDNGQEQNDAIQDFPLQLQSKETPQKRKFAQIPMNSKKQRVVMQRFRVTSGINDESNKPLTDVSNDPVDLIGNSDKFSKDTTNIDSLEQPFKLLQAHGITMIPLDNDATIVESAMERGQTVVLTEAGKLALSLSRGSQSAGVKRVNASPRKVPQRKVITIRADQILGHGVTNVRGPNILKRTPIVDSKSGKLILASIGGHNATLAAAKNVLAKLDKSPPKKIDSTVLQLDDDIEEINEEDGIADETEQITDIALLNKQLMEARRQAAEYRKLLEKKEEEAENYKQQLKNITSQRASQ